ncbi:MAG: hypothetical protein AUG75_00195 [Cyanobacteria bacterium 13_1_20CM_4_61_6]|nr:MAG: hypothetical protein AUG75_00195 [Cyanobacteria bacterium 13_1_20CM_4_61_6]
MTDAFSKQVKKWDFNSIVPDILRGTQLPLPVATAKNSLKKNALSAFYAKPTHSAAYWAAKTEGFDFSREDRVDAAKYNLIQWQGLLGENVPYPSVRDGRDLSKNRAALLRQWRQSRIVALKESSSTSEKAVQAGGGK